MRAFHVLFLMKVWKSPIQSRSEKRKGVQKRTAGSEISHLDESRMEAPRIVFTRKSSNRAHQVPEAADLEEDFTKRLLEDVGRIMKTTTKHWLFMCY